MKRAMKASYETHVYKAGRPMMPFQFFSSRPPFAPPYEGAAGEALNIPLWYRPKYYGVISPPIAPHSARVALNPKVGEDQNHGAD
jgi:hypothetical protein